MAAKLNPDRYGEVAENFKAYETPVKMAMENQKNGGGDDLSKLSRSDIQRMLDTATDR